MQKLSVISCYLLMFCTVLSAQQNGMSKDIDSTFTKSVTITDVFERGISIKYGYGNYSVRDEFLTTEKYSGVIPFFSIGWTKYSDESGFRISFSVHNSDKIKNKNMNADVLNFSLAWDYFYHINTYKIFSKDWLLLAGPSAEMFLYSNKQNYASDGIFFDFSFASLISIGGNVSLLVPITEKIIAESSLRTNLFSVGIRIPLVNEIDGIENDRSRFKLLSAIKALNASFDLGLRYFLWGDLSLKAQYRFQFTNISVWEKMSSASDHFVFSISYNF
ncbi:MAG: hypothetical protein AB1521_07165 [Bacteroidota bacterium]